MYIHIYIYKFIKSNIVYITKSINEIGTLKKMIDFHIISVLVLSNHNRNSDSRSALTVVLDKFSINFIITQPVDFFK